MGAFEGGPGQSHRMRASVCGIGSAVSGDGRPGPARMVRMAHGLSPSGPWGALSRMSALFHLNDRSFGTAGVLRLEAEQLP